MNSILHLTAKDLRRHHWLFLGWVTLLAFQIVMDRAQIATSGPDEMASGYPFLIHSIAVFLEWILPHIQWIFTLVIVPIIVQQDPVTGTKSFWMTRPIQGKDLLLSKITTIFVAVVAPQILSTITLMALYHAPTFDILLALPEILLKEGSFCLLLMAIAAVTGTFSRFALVAVGGWIGSIVLKYFMMIFGFAFSAAMNKLHGNPFTQVAVSLENTQTIIGTSLLSVATLFGLVFLYKRLRPIYAVVVVLLGITLHSSIQGLWTLDLLSAKRPETQLKIDQRAIQMNLDTQNFELESHKNEESNDSLYMEINGKFRFTSPEASYFFEPIKLISYWSLDGDGVRTGSHDWDSGEREIDFSRERSFDVEAIKSTLQIREIKNAESKQRKIELLHLAGDECNHKDKTGTLTGTVRASINQYALTSEISLTPYAFDSSKNQTTVLVHLQHDKETTLELVEYRFDLLFKKTSETRRRFPIDFKTSPHLYLLINRKQSEAHLPKRRSDDLNVNFFKSRRITNRENIKLTFENPGKEWLREATLVRLDPVELGTIELPFEVQDFSPKNARKNAFDSDP